jgi:hypothetical protein
MKRWSARNVAEGIGILGVIGSLIFVGGELRQNAIATRAATNAEVSFAFVELNLMLASSPELARAFAEHADDPAAAPQDAQILMTGSWRALFHIWSNAHRQHLNGTLDPAIYESVVQEISTYSVGAMETHDNLDLVRRQALMNWAWQNERFIYNQEFQDFVDEILVRDTVTGALGIRDE